jgi:hypothetical protein
VANQFPGAAGAGAVVFYFFTPANFLGGWDDKSVSLHALMRAAHLVVRLCSNKIISLLSAICFLGN